MTATTTTAITATATATTATTVPLLPLLALLLTAPSQCYFRCHSYCSSLYSSHSPQSYHNSHGSQDLCHFHFHSSSYLLQLLCRLLLVQYYCGSTVSPLRHRHCCFRYRDHDDDDNDNYKTSADTTHVSKVPSLVLPKLSQHAQLVRQSPRL